MVNPQLMAFVALLRERQDLCSQLGGVTAPEQIVALGAQEGFQFTVQNLREALPLLGGPHWVWAGRDPAWVLAFFAGACAAVGEPSATGPAELFEIPTPVDWPLDRADEWRRRAAG